MKTKIFIRKIISIVACLSIIFNYANFVFADTNVENNETKLEGIETINTDESVEITIKNIEYVATSIENIEKEPENELKEQMEIEFNEEDEQNEIQTIDEIKEEPEEESEEEPEEEQQEKKIENELELNLVDDIFYSSDENSEELEEVQKLEEEQGEKIEEKLELNIVDGKVSPSDENNEKLEKIQELEEGQEDELEEKSNLVNEIASPSDISSEEIEGIKELEEEREEEEQEEEGQKDELEEKLKSNLVDVIASPSDISSKEEIEEINEATPSEVIVLEEEKDEIIRATPSNMFTMHMLYSPLHTNHDGITWTEWTETDSLPTTSGNYYLKDNVTINATWAVPSGTTNLCLNAKTIMANSTETNPFSVITILSGATLNLYDCTNTGSIEGGYGTVGIDVEYPNNPCGGGVIVRSGGSFILKGGIIRHNNAIYSTGGGIYIVSGGNFIMDGGIIRANTALYGNGVYNDGNFIMNGGDITSCGGELGSGVLNFNGDFTMNGGRIYGNRAGDSVAGVLNTAGTFIMNGGAIENNNSFGECGGVYNENTGTFILNGGSISNNTTDCEHHDSSKHGGGVLNYGRFEMNGGNISGNTASGKGGGVYNAGMMKMIDGSIDNNFVELDGGGIYNDNQLEIIGGGIIGNSTGYRGSGGGIVNSAIGKFMMTRGNVQNNVSAINGGGIENYGEFIVSGGTISGNNVEEGKGCGVYVGKAEITVHPFIIGGNVKVTGNSNSFTSEINNLFIESGMTITIGDGTAGSAAKPTTDMKIGVSMETLGVFTSNAGADYVKSFVADKNYTKVIVNEDKTLSLIKQNPPVPTPTPTPYSGGGGGSSGGDGGSPRYDSEGNILGPSGKQSYIYDGSNPPDLTGNINVTQWNGEVQRSQTTNIIYVKNTDSFVRADNTPVVNEWVGVTTNDISKRMWYRTDATGKILKNQLVQIGNDFYYLDNNGIMFTGEFQLNGVTYRFDTTVGVNEGKFLY